MKKRMSMVEHDLDLYYNPKYNGFHVVHKEQGNKIVLGGCCRFVDDAFTNITRKVVYRTYLKNLVKVDKSKIESYDFVQCGCDSLPDTYLATESKEDKTHLMFEDSAIINSYYSEKPF